MTAAARNGSPEDGTLRRRRGEPHAHPLLRSRREPSLPRNPGRPAQRPSFWARRFLIWASTSWRGSTAAVSAAGESRSASSALSQCGERPKPRAAVGLLALSSRRHGHEPYARRAAGSTAGSGRETRRWWKSCSHAAARAASQLPYMSPTTLAGGQSPSSSRSSACPPRRRAWVRTSRRRRGGGRSGPATRASRRAPVRVSIRSRSRLAGTPCSIRRRRPCRCAAACTRRSRATPPRSGP
jgi:hypothetical protein